MLLDAALLALVVAVTIGRGSLVRLKDLDLRAPGLFLLAALIKVLLMILGMRESPLATHVGVHLNIVSYGLILLGLWWNRRHRPLVLVGLGVILNVLVIFANGGSMPVDRDLAVRAGNAALVELLDSPAYVTHTPITTGTRLRALADVLALPLLIPRPRFFSPGSIGDVFITLGSCWLLLAATGAFGLRLGNKEALAPDRISTRTE